MAANHKKIYRIRTGGQSGVDRAAMDFAREYGIPLCGWCPKNGWAEDYPDSPGVLLDYPELTETPSDGTEQRTKWNMRDADAILTIIPGGSLPSPGTDVGLAAGETTLNEANDSRRKHTNLSKSIHTTLSWPQVIYDSLALLWLQRQLEIHVTALKNERYLVDNF